MLASFKHATSTNSVIAAVVGAGDETRTHEGFPTAYKTVAIAAMRLQLWRDRRDSNPH